MSHTFPKQHPQRAALHNEVHARPPEPMQSPLAISHIVMACDADQRRSSQAHLAALLHDLHLPQPDADCIHLRCDLGTFRIRWEMHTEFVTWTFMRKLGEAASGVQENAAAIEAVPQAWLAALPGECLSAMHLGVLPLVHRGAGNGMQQALQQDMLVAATLAQGCAEVYTDFSIHADGYSRMVLLAEAMTPRRLGRLVQQLLEIETYRMAALLGLPAAREASAVLATAERELAELAQAIRSAERHDEPQLLDRLTRLAGQVESQHAASHSRLSASAAYFALVDTRIGDIAEAPLAGLQTIGEFMERRLTPARSTCAWAARRQDSLSQRVSRISNLLRTRVEIEQQQSSQAVLRAMNRRQDTQLKLQSTVEGLSVAAITYYIVGLVGYLAKGAQKAGWPLAAETVMAVAIPVVALAVWASLRRLHHRLAGAPAQD